MALDDFEPSAVKDMNGEVTLKVRRDLFEQLGRLDEAFAPAYYEETDLCMRIRSAGFRVVYDPRVVVHHFEFASSVTSIAPASAAARRATVYGNRKPKSRAVAAVLGGDLYKQTRAAHTENRQKGDVDVEGIVDVQTGVVSGSEELETQVAGVGLCVGKPV